MKLRRSFINLRRKLKNSYISAGKLVRTLGKIRAYFQQNMGAHVAKYGRMRSKIWELA